MNKIEIVRILEKTARELEVIINTATSFLSACGKGQLNLRMKNGHPEYFFRTEEGKLEYVSLSDVNKIRELSSRYYNKRLRSSAIKEKKQIERCITILKKDPEISDVDKVAERIPKAVMVYAVLSELTSEGYARSWQERNDIVTKRRTHNKDDYHKFRTNRGDYVGSKSEVIIADRLYARGIPYHYEVAFTPENEVDKSMPVFDESGMLVGFESLGFSPDSADTLHPDFYVLNKRTRKAYFWEHLGRMDNPDYCRKNFNRFMRILDAGFVIGEDLLVTHEDSQNPLKTEDIDRTIEKYLI